MPLLLTITPAITDKYVELIIDANTNNDKFKVKYNGIVYDNSGQWYPFKNNLSRIDQVQFNNTCPDLNETWTYVDDVVIAQSIGSVLPIVSDFDTIEGFESWTNTGSAEKISDNGVQTIRIWPFWGSALTTIQKLRFDPPNNMKGRLRALRIMQNNVNPNPPSWEFTTNDSWVPMHYCKPLTCTGGKLISYAEQPLSVLMTPVQSFIAASRSILEINAACKGQDVLNLYWRSSENGLYGIPLKLTNGTIDVTTLDLRQFEQFNGTITHIGLGFGTFGDEKLEIDKFKIKSNNSSNTFLRCRHLNFENAINRPGKDVNLRIVFDHVAGPAKSAGNAVLTTDSNFLTVSGNISVPYVDVGGQVVVTKTVHLVSTGSTEVVLSYNNQEFREQLRIDESVNFGSAVGYEVPEPQIINTDYNIEMYYFGGWSYLYDNWADQYDFPERDTVLGWYQEGLKQVADWQIKWALENGVSFFVFNWFWQGGVNGQEQLYPALNEGFLKAEYKDSIKFALMLSNHPPFDGHTHDQLMAVTDYWISNYFNKLNYLKVEGGKPYVCFFSYFDLLTDLGSNANIASEFANMRARCISAGMPGLHIAGYLGTDYSRDRLQAFKDAGFDSVTEYTNASTNQILDWSDYRTYLRGHKALWNRVEGLDIINYTPTLTAGWDKRPWDGQYTLRRYLRKTQDFRQGLKQLKAILDETDSNMAIIEAWNELGEGSYVEPTIEFGFKDLEAIRNTFAKDELNWPKNICPNDVGLNPGKYDVRVSECQFSTVMNTYGFETEIPAVAFTLGDYDPLSLPWYAYEGDAPNTAMVFSASTVGADSQWIRTGNNALRFLVAFPNPDRSRIWTSLQDSTHIRWTFYVFTPSNAACYYPGYPRVIDFSLLDPNGIIGVQAHLCYYAANDIEIAVTSPAHSAEMIGFPIAADSYHKLEIEATIENGVKRWYMRVDDQPFDNNGAGLSFYDNDISQFSTAQVRSYDVGNAVIYIDDVKTEKEFQ